MSRNLKRKTRSCIGKHEGACLRLATGIEVDGYVSTKRIKKNDGRHIAVIRDSPASGTVQKSKEVPKFQTGEIIPVPRAVEVFGKFQEIDLTEVSDEEIVVVEDAPLMIGLTETERRNIKSLYLGERQLELLTDTKRYVDDTVIQAGNILLRELFDVVLGFENTLYQQTPHLRTKRNPTAANIFHGGKHEHFTATVYVESNSILYMDTLKPGGKPPAAIVKQMRESYNLEQGSFTVKSAFVQKQCNVDCGAFAIANLWNFLSGYEPRKTRFRETSVREELYKSFKTGKFQFSRRACKARRSAKVYKFKV